MRAFLRVQTRESAMEMIVACVTTTVAHSAVILVPLNAWKGDATCVGDMLLSDTNIGASFAVINQRWVCATPILNDRVLHGCKACLKGAKDVRIRSDSSTFLNQLMLVECCARNAGATTISKQ